MENGTLSDRHFSASYLAPLGCVDCLPLVFRIFFPVLRICLDVIGNGLQLSLVADDMFVIIALPDRSF